MKYFILTGILFSQISFAESPMKFKKFNCSNGGSMNLVAKIYLKHALKKTTYDLVLKGNTLTRTINDECTSSVMEYEVTDQAVEIKDAHVTGVKLRRKNVIKNETKDGCVEYMTISDKNMVLINKTKSSFEIIDPEMNLLSNYCNSGDGTEESYSEASMVFKIK